MFDDLTTLRAKMLHYLKKKVPRKIEHGIASSLFNMPLTFITKYPLHSNSIKVLFFFINTAAVFWFFF